MDRRSSPAGGVALAAAGIQALTSDAARAASTALLRTGTLPIREDVVAILLRVADRWIGTHPGGGGNQWANATLMSGLIALYRPTSNITYLNFVTGRAQSHAYGLSRGNTTRVADSQTASQACLDANGVVGEVRDRPGSSQPVTFDGAADFGVGGFLLGGTEPAPLAASGDTGRRAGHGNAHPAGANQRRVRDRGERRRLRPHRRSRHRPGMGALQHRHPLKRPLNDRNVQEIS